MVKYTGKAICGFNCQKRAKFKAERAHLSYIFACEEHVHRIEHLPDPTEDSGHLTEADYQTWMRL